MTGWRKKQIAEITASDHPVSPFEWQKEVRPSIFAKDMRFTGRYKVTPVKHPEPLRNVTWKI
jgi:hypothetical protein